MHSVSEQNLPLPNAEHTVAWSADERPGSRKKVGGSMVPLVDLSADDGGYAEWHAVYWTPLVAATNATDPAARAARDGTTEPTQRSSRPSLSSSPSPSPARSLARLSFAAGSWLSSCSSSSSLPRPPAMKQTPRVASVFFCCFASIFASGRRAEEDYEKREDTDDQDEIQNGKPRGGKTGIETRAKMSKMAIRK